MTHQGVPPIPRRLHRVVPQRVPDCFERYWAEWQRLHPGWEFFTWSDPIDSMQFETGHLWDGIKGAQLAGYVRLEVLWRFGGIYVDMDVEPMRSLEPLLPLGAFAAWEDTKTVPDAVIGASEHHPAIRACIDRVLSLGPTDDPWQTGPGTTTAIFPLRTDVMLLPPDSFYPYHFSERHRACEDFSSIPWCYGVHRWNGSWLPKPRVSNRFLQPIDRATRPVRQYLKRSYRKWRSSREGPDNIAG
jgi:hypothetical protein